ncbi:unnamed protein product [Lampetra planeri]
MPLLVKLRPAPAAKAPSWGSLEVLWGRVWDGEGLWWRMWDRGPLVEGLGWRACGGGFGMEGLWWRVLDGGPVVEGFGWRAYGGGSWMEGLWWRVLDGGPVVEGLWWRVLDGGPVVEGLWWRVLDGGPVMEGLWWRVMDGGPVVEGFGWRAYGGGSWMEGLWWRVLDGGPMVEGLCWRKQQQRRRRQQQRQQQWQQRQQGQQQGQQRQQGQQQQGLLSPCRSDDATGAPAATPRVTAPGSARQVTPPPSPHCRLRAHPKDAVASCRDPNLQRPSSPRARGRVSSSSFHARRAEPMNLLHRDRHAHRLGTSIGVLAGPFASAINLVTKRLLMSASALVKSSMGRLFFVLLLLLLPKDNEAAATIISHGWNSCPDLPEYWGREGQGLGTSSVFSAFIFIRFSAEPRFCA